MKQAQNSMALYFAPFLIHKPSVCIPQGWFPLNRRQF